MIQTSLDALFPNLLFYKSICMSILRRFSFKRNPQTGLSMSDRISFLHLSWRWQILWMKLWSANESITHLNSAWTLSNENGFFLHLCPVKGCIILLFQSSSVFLAFLHFKRILFTYSPHFIYIFPSPPPHPHWKCRFGFLLSGWSQYLSKPLIVSKQQNICGPEMKVEG